MGREIYARSTPETHQQNLITQNANAQYNAENIRTHFNIISNMALNKANITQNTVIQYDGGYVKLW